MMNSENSQALNYIFTQLNAANLLNTSNGHANRVAVLYHSNPQQIGDIFFQLNEEGLLTQATFDAIITHHQPREVSCTLIYLQQAGMFTDANRDTVVLSQNPMELVQILLKLENLDLLSSVQAQANFNAIATHPFIKTVMQAIYYLKIAGLLNSAYAQINFNGIIRYAHIMGDDPEIRNSWQRITPHTLTQTRWTQMVALCDEHQNNPDMAKTTWLNFLNLPVIPINDAQSTHTTSVHHSSSASAIKLLTRYQHHLIDSQIDTYINDLTTWLNTLDAEDYKHEVAKSCVTRLINNQENFTDPSSGINLTQLLALNWIAIHDRDVINGTLIDAKALLIEGLCEIQRGYNLSETGDLGDIDDDPICLAGAFNKLMEKLHGIHPDVTIIFISQRTAALKLPIIVKEEVHQLLASRVNPTTSAGFLRITKQLTDINKLGVEAIWIFKRERIAMRLFAEFGSLYINFDDPLFTKFVNTGLDVDLREIPSFQKELSESKGYQEFCSTGLKFSGFFSRMVRGEVKVGEEVYQNTTIRF